MKATSAPPFQLPPRYQFQNQVLKGGQGDVYICRDLSLERPVAIKTLHDGSDITALTKEIAGRAKIKSKHVAELYECLFDPRGKPSALVMEYVPGDSLADPAVHPASRDGLMRLLYQVAAGIADIHAAGVIHRDIKPLNMKVDGSAILKIFDLGIANLNADTASTVGGAGTYVFRAPELYKGLPAKVSPAVDVYALGVICWYLLTQDFPDALVEVPPLSSGKSLPSFSTVDPELGPISSLLDLALSVDASDRPTAADLRDALAAHITHAQRRGVFSSDMGIFELKSIGTITRIEIKPYGTLRVAYAADGRFVIRQVEGAVFINNLPATVGIELPDSCVLTFGPVEAGALRKFVPFDVSQPEIVL